MNTLLTTKEKTVLEALYKLEDRSVSLIAQETLINRTSLYPILEKLSSKGIVTKSELEDRTIYDPIEKDQFIEWLRSKENEVKKDTQSIQEWFSGVDSSNSSPALYSKIKYFEGFDGVKNLYSDSWRENKGKQIYAITDVKAAVATMGEFFRNDYMPERVKRGVRVKDIMTQSEDARVEQQNTSKYLREVKLAKDLFKDLEIELNIYDDKVAIVAYDSVKPSGVLIKNQRIANAMKNIFEYLWNKTK